MGTVGALAALLLSASGCQTDAFCFACGATSGPDAGNQGGGGAGGQGGEGGIIIGPGQGGGGNCAADILTDPQNCGACGVVCNIPNAFPKCEGGFCLVDTCAAGFLDLDSKVENG